MREKKTRRLAAVLALALLLAALPGCGNQANAQAFQSKADALRGAALDEQVLAELVENPAGAAGCAVFFSVCGGEERARVYHATGDTPEAAWDAAVEATGTALQKNGPYPLWVKADLVYLSSDLPAKNLAGIGEVFGTGGFRYGLAFDPKFETALLEAELNSAGIYDYENGGVELETLNDYLRQTGAAPLDALPETYTAFQCAGWFCDEEGTVLPLSPDDTGYGRRELSAVDGSLAGALVLDGAEFLAAQVQEDGSLLEADGEQAAVARHADALSALLRGYQLYPSEELAGGIDRLSEYLLGQIAYAENDMAFLLDNGEITLEDSALSVIALADCAEASGEEAYISACTALGAGMLSLLDTETGTFTQVLDANDLSRKEAVRDPAWDGMGVTAFCRLYGLTEDSLWLWAAGLVMDRMIAERPDGQGDVWTAYALREITKYVQDRTDYFTYALKQAQGSLAALYEAQGAESAGLELLLLSYETYRGMLDAGCSADGFAADLLLEVIGACGERQLDGYLFPEYAMYFDQPQKILGAFLNRAAGLQITVEDVCRNICGYALYAGNYDSLLEDGMEAANPAE